jgi:hypothetical protein
MERPITIQPADHQKPAQLGNFTSAHLGKFESALTGDSTSGWKPWTAAFGHLREIGWIEGQSHRISL